MIAAVVLAAGRSSRMGQPKMLLPWGSTTVIGQVVATLAAANLDQIVVVTGPTHAAIQNALTGQPVKCIPNPMAEHSEMLESLQVGLTALEGESIEAALVVLGDHPQMPLTVVRQVVDLVREDPTRLVVPSYHLRRGHPWALPGRLWAQVANLQSPATLRDFLRQQAEQIVYLNGEDALILQDLDTPEDYRRSAPGG